MEKAKENMRQVAEAQVRLAAAGDVSTETLGKNTAAFQFLRNEIERTQQSAKKQTEQEKQLAKAFEAFNRPALSAAAGIAATGAALLKFQHAANPQLFGAFETQLQLLQAKVGNALLPLFSELMDGVDDVIEWFEGLTEGQKKLVAGLAVGLPLVLGFARALYTLGPAFSVAAASLEKLRASAVAHPYMAAAGGGAAALAGMYAFYQMIQADNEKQYDRVQEQKGRTGRVTSAELRQANAVITREGAATDEDLEKKSEADRRAYFAQRAKLLRERAEAMQRQHDAAKKSNPLMAALDPFGLLHGGYKTEGEINERRQAALIYERASKEGADLAPEAAWRKKVGRLNQQLVAASREQQPRYSGLADVHKQIQLSVLGKNPYEQQLLQEQRKSREILAKMLEQAIKDGQKKGYHLTGQ